MTPNDVLNLFKKYKTPKGVLRHSVMVNGMAQCLASNFNLPLDFGLIDYSSILHDVLRIIDIKNPKKESFEDNENWQFWMTLREKYKGMHHADAAYELLKERYPDIAEVIRKHKFTNFDELKTWEEKIVYYSDKRVDFDRIVSLDERFKRGKIRNGISNKRTIYEDNIKGLEKDLFTHTNCNDVYAFMKSDKYHDWNKILRDGGLL